MANTDRIDSILRKELSIIISQEINDKKLGFPTVTDVRTAPDLSVSRVYVSFLGKGYMKRDGLETLRRSKGFIKSTLAKRVKMRKIPDLTFIVDDTLDSAERIDEILNKQ